MPEIQFTISQAVEAFLWICGTIVAIAAAANVFFKIRDHYRKPNQLQNEEISNLWKEVGKLKDENRKMQEEFLNYFDNDKKRLDTIEKGNRVMQQALLALLRHGLDGNDVEGMKKAENDLQEYLIEK